VDQVKKALSVLNKYKFWITCAILALLPLGMWFTSTAGIDKSFAERKSKIESAMTTAKNIAAVENHPNPYSHEGLSKSIEQTTQSVLAAWMAQYQKQENILVWPKELREDLRLALNKYRPIESNIEYPTPPEQELRNEFREDYRDYIKDELPKLAEIIGAKWMMTATAPGADSGMMGGYGGGYGSYGGTEAESGYGPAGMAGAYGAAGMSGMSGMSGMPGMSGMYGSGSGPGMLASQEEDFVVNWDSGDQGRLRARFDWSNNPEKRPNTIDMLYAQEDLWVLNALMNIIKETNREATANYNAIIKQLNYIQLGRSVTPAAGRVQRVTAAAAGGYGAYGSAGMESMDMYGAESSSTMGDMMAASMAAAAGAGTEGETGLMTAGPAAAPDPAERRYVDNNYQPLPAADVRAALAPDAKDPEKAFLVVAKRIPIRMGLTMDQRRLPRLIAACGNSNLMVEVRQVRVNKKSSITDGGYGAMGGGGGMGGMMAGMGGGGYGSYGMEESGSGFGGGYGMEGMDMGGGYGGYGGMGGMATSAMKSSYDLPVEIYGIVYIYNPVDKAKLGIEQVAEADGTNAAPAEPAAAVPAAEQAAAASAPATSLAAE